MQWIRPGRKLGNTPGAGHLILVAVDDGAGGALAAGGEEDDGPLDAPVARLGFQLGLGLQGGPRPRLLQEAGLAQGLNLLQFVIALLGGLPRDSTGQSVATDAPVQTGPWC